MVPCLLRSSDAIMHIDNDTEVFDKANANSHWVNPRLPAVIPPASPSVAAQARRRFALPPQWRLLAVAALALGLGFETAILWPYKKLAAVLHLSGHGG